MLAIAAAIYFTVVADWWGVGVAVLVLVASLGNAVARTIALIVALLFAAWPAAVAAGVAVLASALGALPGAAPARPLDRDALVAAVHSLPPAERSRIERATDGLVDSLALVRAAVADDSTRWSVDGVDVSGAGFDGGAVEDLGWTLVACEAALVAAHRPDKDRAVDVHHLAAASLLLPHSAAAVRLGTAAGTTAAAVLGLVDEQAIQLLVRTSRARGAELISPRVERLAGSMRGRANVAMTELTEDEWRRLGA
ncbi:hypothetical protein [Pseudonocardia oroxyli]|uniref:hypothetical protein n=1 Tax=Pseudonocardia oroxyli TaxID=366584 RepID=UPI0011600893|nr:hypothetical protein [Pseudonocardia oroxyli]